MIQNDNEINLIFSVITTGSSSEDEIIDFAFKIGNDIYYFERNELNIQKFYNNGHESYFEGLANRDCAVYNEIDIIKEVDEFNLHLFKDNDINIKEKFFNILNKLYKKENKKINFIFFNNIESFYLNQFIYEFENRIPKILNFINPMGIDIYTLIKVFSKNSEIEKIIDSIQFNMIENSINDSIILSDYIDILFEEKFK